MSGHKTFAPTGVGAIYIKQELLGKGQNRIKQEELLLELVTYNASLHLLDSPF